MLQHLSLSCCQINGLDWSSTNPTWSLRHPLRHPLTMRSFKDTDECLKHSYYTRVGLSFFRLFDSNFIVFVARPLIWCLVWMQVHWSENSSCWKQFLEQWRSEQGSDCHVATSRRRDVPTPRRHDVGSTMQKSTSGNVATFQRRR